MPEKVSFAAFFGPNRNDMTNRANWGLKEYRKYDPQALSDDPELYARLREKEYGEEQEPYHNLVSGTTSRPIRAVACPRT